MGWMLDGFGHVLARYLEKPASGLRAFHAERSGCAARLVEARRRPADRRQQPHLRRHQVSHAVHLVARGTLRRSATRTHIHRGRRAACVGRGGDRPRRRDPRRCRNTSHSTPGCAGPSASADDCAQVCDYAIERWGWPTTSRTSPICLRYLFPLPVPQRWRRRDDLARLRGSDRSSARRSSHRRSNRSATRSCQGQPRLRANPRGGNPEIRHHSLYAPRDFDISPYFAVVKPTIVNGFDYKRCTGPTAAARPKTLSRGAP